MFEDKDYTAVADEQTAELTFKYKTIDNHEVKYKDENNNKKSIYDKILITWSPKRAAADRKKRQQLIDKATHMLQKGIVPNSKKGAKRYIELQGKPETVGLDQDQIDNMFYPHQHLASLAVHWPQKLITHSTQSS